MTPAAFLSIARKSAVAPSRLAVSACGASASMAMLASVMSRAFPNNTLRPSTVPATPFPVVDVNCVALVNATFRPTAAATIAAASGCSLERSRLAASARISASVKPGAVTTEVTFGLPSVSVPVLSTTSVSTFSKRSSASADLMSTPMLAPFPTPTPIDIGVASPSAQGHAMITTETAAINAYESDGFGPTIAQTANAIAAMASTVGTKYPATVSASF